MGTGATAVNRVFPVARGRRPPRTATTKQMLTLVDLRGGAPSKVSPVQHAADHQGARDAAAVIDAVRDELDPEATASALRTWTDGLHTFAGNESALPDVKSMVKQYFDTVQQVLDSQRRLTEALFTVADTARTVSDQYLGLLSVTSCGRENGLGCLPTPSCPCDLWIPLISLALGPRPGRVTHCRFEPAGQTFGSLTEAPRHPVRLLAHQDGEQRGDEEARGDP